MTRPVLDSMLLGTADAERLAAWYATALDPSEDTKVDHYRVLRFGSFHLLIDQRDDVAGTNPDPARVLLNFDVADARAVAGRLDDMGARWLAEVEDRDGSLFGTAIDPDGNYVQIIQLSAEQRAQMADGDPNSPLAAAQPYSGFAVDDIPAARAFYGDTLGLKVTEENGMLTLHLPGQRTVLVYPKPGHTPAACTILNFPIPDVDAAVDGLASRGLRFERYDGFDHDDKGIVRGDDSPPIAWFTDPAGNILSVHEE
jgi:catechol 2,3-dioxygenase-like lactoylglutathione lyase family enzyme